MRVSNYLLMEVFKLENWKICYCSNFSIGYSHVNLVTPKLNDAQDWRIEQAKSRSKVETVIGFVKNWEVANRVYRGGPENQVFALLSVYQLAAQSLDETPLRLTQ